MRFGFTGTRGLKPAHHATVLQALDKIKDRATEVTSGACNGIDVFAGSYMARVAPNAIHRVIVPDNQSQVDASFQDWATEIFQMDPGTTYKQRDSRIVDHSDYLVAFPLHEEDRQPRSGTWMTVRIAQKRGIKTHIVILEPKVIAEPASEESPTTFVTGQSVVVTRLIPRATTAVGAVINQEYKKNREALQAGKIFKAVTGGKGDFWIIRHHDQTMAVYRKDELALV